MRIFATIFVGAILCMESGSSYSGYSAAPSAADHTYNPTTLPGHEGNYKIWVGISTREGNLMWDVDSGTLIPTGGCVEINGALFPTFYCPVRLVPNEVQEVYLREGGIAYRWQTGPFAEPQHPSSSSTHTFTDVSPPPQWTPQIDIDEANVSKSGESANYEEVLSPGSAVSRKALGKIINLQESILGENGAIPTAENSDKRIVIHITKAVRGLFRIIIEKNSFYGDYIFFRIEDRRSKCQSLYNIFYKHREALKIGDVKEIIITRVNKKIVTTFQIAVDNGICTSIQERTNSLEEGSVLKEKAVENVFTILDKLGIVRPS